MRHWPLIGAGPGTEVPGYSFKNALRAVVAAAFIGRPARDAYPGVLIALAVALLCQQASAGPPARSATIPWGNVSLAATTGLPPAAPTAVIMDDGDEAARVWLSYDAGGLHCVYKVIDASPLKNSGDNWRMFFKTGDSCDLQISLEPMATLGHAAEIAPGDIRVELVPTASGAKAVVIRYKLLPGTPAAPAADPSIDGWAYTSPTGQFTVDRVEVLSAAKIFTRLTDDGYVLSADLPWPALAGRPMTAPAPGTTVGGDIGVLFSDPDGEQTVERVYWANKDTGIVADVPTEARIVPANWGTFKYGQQ